MGVIDRVDPQVKCAAKLDHPKRIKLPRKGEPSHFLMRSDKGNEFFGIASQDKYLPLRKAVEKEGVGIWKNILDTSQNEHGLAIAYRYTVHSFPTKILVDKRGKIIGRYKVDDEKDWTRISKGHSNKTSGAPARNNQGFALL